MSGYTKLFGSILDSTVWELPHTTVRVWVTLLAMADRHGEIQASVPGLAHRSRVTLKETKKALDAFLSPDEYSRTPDQEGRRIEPIDGGWRLVNHEKYTRMMSEEDRRARGAERQARYAASKKRQQPSAGVSECQKRQNDDTQTQIKTQTDTNSDRIPPAPREKARASRRAYPPEFDALWESVLKIGGLGNSIKGEAFDQWHAVGKPIEHVAERWSQYIRSLPEFQTTPKHFGRWLKARGHEQEYRSAKAANAGPSRPDPNCRGWHKGGKNTGRKHPSGRQPMCPECKSIELREWTAEDRPGEPTTIGEIS